MRLVISMIWAYARFGVSVARLANLARSTDHRFSKKMDSNTQPQAANVRPRPKDFLSFPSRPQGKRLTGQILQELGAGCRFCGQSCSKSLIIYHEPALWLDVDKATGS